MEKYLSSGGDKNNRNFSSKIFNNSKEKNIKSKSKPKPENIIGNQLFFSNNNNKIKNVENNSLFEIQDNLFVPKMIYHNNIKGDKNQYHNIRLNNRGEKTKDNKNIVEDEYKEKINNRDLKIVELKEELKLLEKNYNDNNKNLINRYQNSSKSNNKNIFLFYNSRNGNVNSKNKINKKENDNKIIYKNNNKNLKNKSKEKKKAKSTPKIGGYLNEIKNNYIFAMSNKKSHNLNFCGINMGKSLDYKKNAHNNNIINSQVLKNNINNIQQNNNVKIININNDNNNSKEIDSSKNLKINKDKCNNVKKNWSHYQKTEPTENISNLNTNPKNINNINININNNNTTNKQKNISSVFSKISSNFIDNYEGSNLNSNGSAKSNIIINNQNLINCYVNNNNFNNNNLNIYINKNNDNISSQNSYNNTNINYSSNNSNNINVNLIKSKNSNTPTSKNSNCFYEKEKIKFDIKENIYDDKKYEILEKNIQNLFNQYFQYYYYKTNSNKK